MPHRPRLWGVETTAQELAHEMARSIPVTVASVAVWDRPRFSLTVKGVSALREVSALAPVDSRVPLATARHHRAVFERNEPLLLERGPETRVAEGDLDPALSPRLRSVYLMPIRVGAETVGILSLGEMRSPDRAAFGEAKRERCREALARFLETSAHAWEAGRLRRQLQAMHSLLRLVREVGQARTYQDVLDRCASEVADWLGTPVRGLLLRPGDQGTLEIAAERSLPRAFTSEDAAQLLLTVIREAGREAWPVNVRSVAEDPLDPLYDAIPAGEVWTRLTLPLLKGSRLLGVVCLYVEDALAPSEWEMEALRRRAEIGAMGVDLVGRLEEHRQEQQHLRRAAYEFLTTCQRAVLREVFAGLADQVARLLPDRVDGLIQGTASATGGDQRWTRELADAMARELAGVMTELLVLEDDGGAVPPAVEVGRVLDQAIAIAQARWEGASAAEPVSVERSLELLARPAEVRASAVLIAALVHAIHHAIDAAPTGQGIRVRAHRDNGHVLISLGGVPDHEREGDVQGAALAPAAAVPRTLPVGGLSLVQALVGRHGGEALLSHGSEGRTCLTVRVPLADVVNMGRDRVADRAGDTVEDGVQD
jgi:signal transduction histidine kinase